VNNNLFKEMISGFVEAKKYRAGKKTKMRVSRVAFEPVSMKPAEIRRVRTRLRFSQPELRNSFVLASERYEVGNKAPANHKVRHSGY
jgi:DNA-binding transcriptional regulator YiaG